MHPRDSLADVKSRFATYSRRQCILGHRADGDGQVESVPQGAREATRASLDLAGGASAFSGLVSGESTGTRVHGADQHEPGRENSDAGGVSDANNAFLEGLSQNLQRPATKLGYLVQEEYAVVSEADLTRPRFHPTPDQRHIGRRVMRGAERPRREQPAVVLNQTDDGMNGRGLDRFIEGRGGEESRQPLHHHGLPGARRPNQEQVVTTRGRDFKRTTCKTLPLDIGHVLARRRRAAVGLKRPHCHWANERPVLEHVDRMRQGGQGADVEALDGGGLKGPTRRSE